MPISNQWWNDDWNETLEENSVSQNCNWWNSTPAVKKSKNKKNQWALNFSYIYSFMPKGN